MRWLEMRRASPASPASSTSLRPELSSSSDRTVSMGVMAGLSYMEPLPRVARVCGSVFSVLVGDDLVHVLARWRRQEAAAEVGVAEEAGQARQRLEVHARRADGR